jgi:hypothetical protein
VDFSGAGIWGQVTSLGAKPGKTRDEGFEDPGTERQEVEFAFAGDVDQAGGFQLLDVMGKSGGGNGQSRADLRAAQGAVSFGDPFQKLKAPGVGQGLEDGSAAGAGKRSGFANL